MSESSADPADLDLDPEVLLRHLHRTRKARRDAESLLESKIRELYEKNQDLRRLALNLEDIIHERTADLEAARDVAEAANTAKTVFLANMSHELRTPLTAIIGFAETVLDGDYATKPTEEINTIIRNSYHLLDLLNEILDLSKIEAGQLGVEKISFSLHELLYDIEAVVAMQAKDKGINFHLAATYPLPNEIISDPLRLKQILMNLCNNAVKFTDKGSVTLQVSYRRDKHALQFSITDTGVGIPPDKLDLIFSPFQQADSSISRRYGGTGLGLCIAKQLAEKLGGHIQVQSEVGKGTTFIVDIAPGGIEESQFVWSEFEIKRIPSAPKRKSYAKVRGKILLAEDNPDNQKLVQIYLKKIGADVTVVDNGLSAVETALKEEFDLILMDMQMPIMDGLQATRSLRDQGYDKPIIALSANAAQTDMAEFREAGCNKAIAKPIDQNRFFSIITNILPLAKNEQSNARPELFAADEALLADPEYQELMLDFQSKLREYGEGMLEAVANKDWYDLKSRAHKMKGTAGDFGFPELGELAARIDKLIGFEDYKNLPKLVNDLATMCEALSREEE